MKERPLRPTPSEGDSRGAQQEIPARTYLWVRTDLPPADQIVQAAHVAQAAGARWGVPPHCRLVLLAACDEEALCAVKAFCEAREIPILMFYEPDAAQKGELPMGYTALCTAPLPGQARRWFRRFPLWRA